MKKVLVKKNHLSNSRDRREISPMPRRGLLTNKYKEYVQKQNKRTVVAVSAIIAGLLFIFAFAITFPFQDQLFRRLFPKDPSAAAAIPPTYIQSITTQLSAPGTVVSATWSAPTTANNFLVAVLTANGSGVTVTQAPVGWVRATEQTNSTGLYQYVYYYPNAPSQSSAVSFTLSTSAKASLILSEYKDVETTNPLDNTTTSTGINATPSNSLTPTQADRFIISAISADSSVTLATPSAGFTLATQATTTGSPVTSNATSGLLHSFTSSTNPVTSSVEASSSTGWIATSLAFRVKQTAVTPTPTQTPVSTEWTQDAHDAQRTGYTPLEPTTPWTLAWTWNGPDANGGIGGHFYDAPKEARTVTGGSSVFVPAGGQGLYALAKSNGAQQWNFRTTSFNAAPAYDNGFVYAGGSNGTFYKINATNGSVAGSYSAGSGINKAVLIVGSFAYIVSDDGRLHKVDMGNMTAVWTYVAGATIATPPSYSASRNAIIYATDDLYVHAVNNADGSRKWRVKPTPNNPGDTTVSFTQTVSGAQVGSQFESGWPVIAEQHGVVFLRMQLPHDAMLAYPSTGHIFPNDLATTRSWLQSNPQNKNLFALNLDDGTEKFVPAVGYGSTEDYSVTANRAYGVMGSQPVVKVWPDGSEVAYIHFRNGQSAPPDYRWDGHMGEMVMDTTTISGLSAGDLRFVRMNRRNGYGGPGYTDIIDEQNPITVAGSSIFHSHWAAAEGVRITDRSASRGLTFTTPIEIVKHPPIMRAMTACGTQNATTHYTTCGMSYVTDGGRFYDNPGYWAYWGVADPPGWRVGSGNTSGTSYSAGFQGRYTYVTNGLMVVQGNGGDIMAFSYSGAPTPAPTNTPTPGSATPTNTPPTATPTSVPPTATPTPSAGGTPVTVSYQVTTGSDDGYDVVGSTALTTGNPVFGGGKNSSGQAITAGFRFTGVAIPKGATITSATIDWQEDWSGNFGANVKSRIYGEAADNSLTFSTSSLPRSRTKTTAFATYDSVSENIPAGTWMSATASNKPPQITSVIQEIVNRTNWASGNALSLILADNTTVNDWWWEFRSVEAGAATAPKLTVTYTTGGPIPTTAPTATPTPVPTYTLSGNVYVDANRNGVKDTGEVNQSNATLTVQGAASRTTTTDTSGNYSFSSLPTGAYGVSVTPPAGYSATTTNPVNTTISANTTINFGIALTPTATPGGATNTPAPTSAPATLSTFNTTKAGFVDANPRQIVRASNDRIYMFASVVQTPRVLRAYWSNTGYPASATDFSGTTQVSTTSELISADAVYDGGSIIHVLVNDMAGTIRDYPFDTSTNTFKSPLTIATGGGTPGSYTDIGTVGVSGMYDKTNTLHIAYWTSTNQIIYRSYTYASSTNTLTQTSGPTRLDSSGNANHPQVVVSPLDNSVTVGWVNGQNGAGTMSARSRTSSGTWGSIEAASAGAVWTSPNAGINIDQGPSIVITDDGTKHLIYMENFGSCGSDYGRIHYVKKATTDATWVDQSISNFCSHAPGIATNSSNELYIFGHGHPVNPSCTSMLDMCYVKRNTNGLWTNPVVYKTHPGSDSLDASVSVKWGVVGWNRPESIEVAYFAAINGSYANTEIYYGRISSSVTSPTNTPTPGPTATPTPVPTYTLSGTVFVDTDSNGVQDAGETGYANAVVTRSGGISVTTNASGVYTFTAVPAATYTVSVTLPNGYVATTTNPATVALNANSTQHFGIVQTPAPQIENVTTAVAPSTKFTKAEWVFNLSKTYENPYYYFDSSDTPAANPSNMTWTGSEGVSVDMNLTSPTGKTIKVPAFWMEDYTRVRNSGFEVLGKRDDGRWHVRFTPSEVGTYQYYLTAQDKAGIGRYPATGTQSFTVADSSKKGFVRISPKDPRFMAYDNGSPFVPIPAGRQWWHGSEGGLRSYSYEDLFNTYFGPNKVNLVRIWDQSDFALALEEAQPVWIREGFSTIPGAALGTEIGTTNVHSGLRAARPATGQGWYQRLTVSEPTRAHKLTVWMKTASVSDQAQVNIKNGTFFNSGTQLGQVTSDSQAASNWTQYSVTFTPNTSVVSVNLLRSAGTGNVYIDDISFGPTDASGNITYNIVTDAGMERHFAKGATGNDPDTDATLPRPIGNYMNPWSAYEIDKIVESAESNGVAIQLCSCSGPWFTWPVKADQINYADTWVLKSWQRNFRYRVARWGYSPAILAWEKHNEHGHVPAGSDLYNFYQSYGAFQKNTDPYGHLRTTSQGSQAFSPALWSSGAMDLANYHDYMMQFRSADITNDEPHFVAYARAWCLRYQGGYCAGFGLGDGSSWTGSQKPWVWGELDVGTAVWDQANPATINGEGRLRFLRNSLWSGLFSPLGTSGLDWYWDNEDTATKNAKYAQRKAAADFFAAVDYDGGNFTYFMTDYDKPPSYTGEIISVSNDPSTKVRVLAMRRSDRKAAYAWVQHRDNSWSTAPTVPTAVSPTITIANLLNTDTYTIQVWNTTTGTIISTTTQTPSSGSISFTVNNLTSDVAVKIESSSPAPTPTPTVSPLPTSVVPTNTPPPTATPTPTPVPTYTLSGTVYVDANGNGVQDTGETGYNGATVTRSGGVSVTSNASGVYTFTGVPAATYSVLLTVPSGYSATTTNPASVALNANSTQHFGIRLAPTSTPGTGISTEWHQLQHDSQRTGRTTAFVPPGYEVAWAWADKNHIVKNFVNGPFKSIDDGFESGYSFTVQFGQQVQPIIAAEKTYFGSLNGTLYAVDSLTGDNRWDFTTGGPIIATAAYASGVVVTGSVDGKIYGVSAADGSLVWSYQTDGNIYAAPVIHSNTVFVGSGDGSFYALDVTNGNLKWKYDTRDPNNKFNKAVILSPAAVSEDGSTVLFGAENMYFYGLNTSDGSEKWTPKKLIGQSFLYSWPVVKGDKVIIRTMSSLEGAEFVMETVLDGLSADPTWTEEKTAILNWLSQNADQKTMYVLNIATGTEPYQVAMGRVTGNNYAAHPPVVDNQDRVLSYWRTKKPTFIQDTACFGTKYCPDISAIDMMTGDRIKLPNASSTKLAPELDNGFQLTVGGDYLYFANSFRGTHSINLTSGNLTRMTTPIAIWDCGNFRGWGFNVIYYGNDDASTSQCNPNPPSPVPDKLYSEPIGYAGVAIASTNGTSMLYINEPDAGVIVALRKKP